jgi:hypothetical protein
MSAWGAAITRAGGVAAAAGPRSLPRPSVIAELFYNTPTRQLRRDVRTLRSHARRPLFAADGFWVVDHILADGSQITGAVGVRTREATVQTDGAGTFQALHSPPPLCRVHLAADEWELCLPPLDLVSTTPRSL